MEMAKSHNNMSFRVMILILFSLVFGFGVNGMVNNDDTKVDPNSILKTIVSGDEIIDCVDIYKQPAFNHPLLKNHTLQLKPSSYPTGSKSVVSVNSIVHAQMWHREGEYCPKRTVAIMRSSITDIPPKNTNDLNTFSNTNSESPTIYHSEFAIAALPGEDFNGANADINVWNPRVQPKELSVAQVWVSDRGWPKMETVEAGWMVTALKPFPSVFTYWTYDGYGASGCYNVQCSGFIQTSSETVLGAQLEPVSIYNGTQTQVNIKIHRDEKSGNWWFILEGREVGYWPADLFKNLKGAASLIEWGGKVINSNPEGFHTVTQMGSGHFPREGDTKAAWFQNLEYADKDGFFNPAADIVGHATRPECYDILTQPWSEEVGVFIVYGGPGYSSSCQK